MAYFDCFFSHASNSAIYAHVAQVTANPGSDLSLSLKTDAWTDESDNNPNPCFSDSATCVLTMGVRLSSTSSKYRIDNDNYTCINKTKTIGEIRKYFNMDSYYAVKVGPEEITPTSCVGLFYGDYFTQEWKLLPGSMCGIIPPPVGRCKFSGDLTLNYGTLSSSALNGKKISGRVDVICDTNINLSVMLFNPNDGSQTVPLRKDGSLVAKMTLNGKDASQSGEIFSIDKNRPATLEVTSEAIVSGAPDPGEFSGSAVIVLNIT
ncbi:hypothetical protein [Pantoea sp. OXWO6B1]|uniref:MrpH family fimbial adhesin n=1 Tax=Pantoea sp. OXWO6B1 TaxID=1835724 RepID=UPI000AC399B3|nr:hypothetical protein [Pantoea sp. OXWO6B1]